VHILFAASEVTPFAKTGGLADVAGALPAALARSGHDVKVVMPHYAVLDEKRFPLQSRGEFSIRLAGRDFTFGLGSFRLPDNPVEFLFLSNDPLFGRPDLYQEKGRDYPDNLERFSVFSRAVLEVPVKLNWRPDILHANDWQTALTFVYRNAHFPTDPHDP